MGEDSPTLSEMLARKERQEAAAHQDALARHAEQLREQQRRDQRQAELLRPRLIEFATLARARGLEPTLQLEDWVCSARGGRFDPKIISRRDVATAWWIGSALLLDDEGNHWVREEGASEVIQPTRRNWRGHRIKRGGHQEVWHVRWVRRPLPGYTEPGYHDDFSDRPSRSLDDLLVDYLRTSGQRMSTGESPPAGTRLRGQPA